MYEWCGVRGVEVRGGEVGGVYEGYGGNGMMGCKFGKMFYIVDDKEGGMIEDEQVEFALEELKKSVLLRVGRAFRAREANIGYMKPYMERVVDLNREIDECKELLVKAGIKLSKEEEMKMGDMVWLNTCC